MDSVKDHLSSPRMNRLEPAPVPGPVNPPGPAPDPRNAPAARSDSKRSRRSNRPRFGSSLTLSLALHSAFAVAIGGVGVGMAYHRSSGDEAFETTIVFAAAPRPVPVTSIVSSEAEPTRKVENPESASEPEARPSESYASFDLPLVSASELAANAAEAAEATEARATTNATALDRAIGDPRSSWKLASNAVAGLQVGLGSAPPVADCCGEPQPAQGKGAASEIYIYPEVVRMARAEFPEKSQRLGEQGSVLLEMDVGADGLVKAVRVAESSGYSRIDDCAAAAAWDWIFKPAMRNGVPEVSLARHRYTFRLMSSG